MESNAFDTMRDPSKFKQPDDCKDVVQSFQSPRFRSSNSSGSDQPEVNEQAIQASSNESSEIVSHDLI